MIMIFWENCHPCKRQHIHSYNMSEAFTGENEGETLNEYDDNEDAIISNDIEEAIISDDYKGNCEI